MRVIFLILCLFSFYANANQSAVILQYHHVSDKTPKSTSVTIEQFKAHLDWLEQNDFKILPVTKIVEHIKHKQDFEHNKIAGITFDDAGKSVCENAWPILQERNIPFTVFINTRPIEDGYSSVCSWQQIQQMALSELFSAGNHAHTHLHMLENFPQQDLLENSADEMQSWQQQMQDEILTAEKIIEEKLKQNNHLFAYPYGEFNNQLEKIVAQLGYSAFAQNTGAVGFNSKLTSLYRIPISTHYANLESLKVKLNSLDFPASIEALQENPIALSQEIAPVLKLTFEDKTIMQQTNCFNASGEAIGLDKQGLTVYIQADYPFSEGRHRYTCTARSEQKGRYYWMSYQWVVQEYK